MGCDPKTANNYAIRVASAEGHLEIVKYLVEQGCDHEIIRKSIKYEVLQECKIKLRILLNGRFPFGENNYLKMEILKVAFPMFTEYEIMNVITSKIDNCIIYL